MGWSKVLEICVNKDTEDSDSWDIDQAESDKAKVSRIGWLIACDEARSDVIVRLDPNGHMGECAESDDDVRASVYLPFKDRFTCMTYMINECQHIFRVYVEARGRQVYKIGLSVHTEVFVKELEEKGCCKGELNIILALKDVISRGIIPVKRTPHSELDTRNNVEVYDISLPPSTTEEEGCHDACTTRPEQQKILAWMRSIEYRIDTNTNIVPYLRNLHIAGEWYFSMATESFVQDGADTENVFQRGGIVNGHSGLGKCAIITDHVRCLKNQSTPEKHAPYAGNTLIIAPTYLVDHWCMEINKFGKGR
eukprot:6193314-Pleurochrysis_carterae.AAC.1